MEIVIVLFGGAFLAFLLRRPGSKQSSDRPPPSIQKVPAKNVEAAHSSRFDETSATPQIDESLTGRAYVTDGDTIKIKRTQVRLFGIDAPELNHPYGQKAKWALFNLCKGHIVHAEIVEKDDYGRTVAHCYLSDGTDLSAEMVKRGLAIDWPKYSGGKYRNLELPDARKRLFLADARQKGRLHVWERFEARQKSGS